MIQQQLINSKHAISILSIFLAFIIICSVATAAGTASATTVDSFEIAYGVNTPSQTREIVQETITYSRLEISEGYANDYFPEYYNTNTTLSNECAPVAGSMIIGFYDRYHTNLIANFTPGRTVRTFYLYNPMTLNTSYIQSTINTLYSNMSTNSPLPGTTQTQYKNGLTTYVGSKGKTITYTNLFSNGNLNFNTGTYNMVAQLESGKPVSLFLSGYNISDFTINSNNVVISKSIYTGDHIMIAYGYQEVKYFNSSNVNFRTDRLLKVSTGFSTQKSGWYLIGSSETTLNSAEAAFIS